MKKRVVGMILAMGLAAPASAESRKVVCWKDDQGQRMCGDRVPPEYAGRKREVFQDGRVVETTRAAKTPEEIAEEARQARDAEAAAKRAAYDRALLESFRSVKDLTAMRDERLSMLDRRIASSSKSLANNENSLKGLQARADALKRSEKPPDAKLETQIKQFTRAVKDGQNALASYQRERGEIQTKFDGDIARYNELRPPAPPRQRPNS